MPPGAVGAANALPPMVEAAAADAALAIRNSRLLNFVMSPAPSVRTDGPALARLYGLTYQDGGEDGLWWRSPWINEKLTRQQQTPAMKMAGVLSLHPDGAMEQN